jgi:hypothetical protein
MRKVFAMAALVLLIYSCQKETSFEVSTNGNGGGGGSTNGTKLVMMTQKGVDDTSTAIYKYNSSNRIIEQKISQQQGAVSASLITTFTRNSSNMITKAVLSSPEFAAAGISDINEFFSFDATSKKYKSILTRVTMRGTEYIDSAVIIYNASNQIASLIEYEFNGVEYDLSEKLLFTYNGNNVVKEELFAADGTGGWDFDESVSYEYDTKVNPLYYPEDAIALMLSGTYVSYANFFSANNITKRTITTSDPATETGTITYTYNADNRPSTAVSSAAGMSITVKYFYQ